MLNYICNHSFVRAATQCLFKALQTTLLAKPLPECRSQYILLITNKKNQENRATCESFFSFLFSQVSINFYEPFMKV